MDEFLRALKSETNYAYTENGAVTHTTTMSKLYDMFALGGAYRKRSNDDVVLLFKNAYEENPLFARRCLFYLRDIRNGGQGERRFFRVCLRWLAKTHPDDVRANMENIPFYGRWDDLYELYDTPVWNDAMKLISKQLELDVESKTPSLLAKWLKSENTSSAESRKLAAATMTWLGVTPRTYRKMLSELRKRINVLERLMSLGQWDKIEFDKLPSKAGIRYKNAFAKHDLTRERYEKFAKDASTKVNAGALAPYEVVEKARSVWSETDRAMINKYWENLTDYFKDATLNALCVVDTSGSMDWYGNPKPIDVAISLGLYCAERNKGPFANHYISFSSRPQLIETTGIDFVDKVARIYRTNLCENTNIEATFDLLLNAAITNRMTQNELPENIIIISDMEFDAARGHNYGSKETLMEGIRRKWLTHGYNMPKLVFWNVNARNDNIPMRDEAGITFVSGFSAATFKLLLTGKTAQDLMMDTLNHYDRVK